MAADAVDSQQSTVNGFYSKEKNMKKSGSFEDLEVFQRAYRVSLEIHQRSLKLPKAEQYNLADQLRRASKSICANIAEGHGKRVFSQGEFKRYLGIALGSCDEVRVWLRYCFDLEYIDSKQWQQWRNEYKVIGGMLVKLIRSL
jgi:four helix bundle protein